MQTRAKNFSLLTTLVLVILFMTGCSKPVPKLTGEFSVGTTLMSVGTGEPTVSVRFFYPATLQGNEVLMPMIDQTLAKAMEDYMGFPAFANDTSQPSRSWKDAPLAPSAQRFPVVLFDHGNWSFSTQNLRLMEEMASHGYFVGCLQHAGESLDLTPDAAQFKKETSVQKNGFEAYRTHLQKAIQALSQITRLSDAVQASLLIREDPVYKLLGERAKKRLSDMDVVVKALTSPAASGKFWEGKINPEKIALMGHSLGGIVVVEYALGHSKNISAVVNLDGPVFADEQLIKNRISIPALFFYATRTGYGNLQVSHEGMNHPWAHTSMAPCLEVTVRGASHNNFSDLTYIDGLSFFGILGPVDGDKAGVGINARVLAFMDQRLKGVGQGMISDDQIFNTRKAD